MIEEFSFHCRTAPPAETVASNWDAVLMRVRELLHSADGFSGATVETFFAPGWVRLSVAHAVVDSAVQVDVMGRVAKIIDEETQDRTR